MLGTAGERVACSPWRVDRVGAGALPVLPLAVARQCEVLARERVALGGGDMTALGVSLPSSYPGRWPSWPLLVLPDSDGVVVMLPEL